jgi:hypothetical protein
MRKLLTFLIALASIALGVCVRQLPTHSLLDGSGMLIKSTDG